MNTTSTLDACDAAILAERQAGLDARHEPEVGDFVEMPDGTLTRITYVWPERAQLMIGREGRFYLGDYGCNYSGGLSSAVPIESLSATGGRATGPVWFFHHNRSVAHNGIDVIAEFPVWNCSVAE